MLHLLPLAFCVCDSWSSSCFDVLSLSSGWEERRECETQTSITGLDLFCEGQTKCCSRSELFPRSYSSLSPNTVTLSPWGKRSKHTHMHTHSFTMCHRANYQQSGCKRSRVIQVSIPQPPSGSRIRSQKIVRGAEGCQSDGDRRCSSGD